jgi:hypothetical protein
MLVIATRMHSASSRYEKSSIERNRLELVFIDTRYSCGVPSLSGTLDEFLFADREAPVTRHEFAGGFAQLAAEDGLRKVAT